MVNIKIDKMLKINGIKFSSINDAVKATGLKKEDLNRRYFTTGKGTVKGQYIEFDDASEVDINKWLTDNYEKIKKTIKKYYKWDEDLFQDVVIYLIDKVNEGKVKNYEQAIYNRYRGGVLDIKRRNAKNKKIAATQSYICTANDEDYNKYEDYKTKISIENESFYTDEDGIEYSVLDSVERSMWDNGETEQDIEGINYTVKVYCIKQVLSEHFPQKYIKFYFDYLNRDKTENLVSIGLKYKVYKKDASTVIKAINNKLKEPEVIEAIERLYNVSKYNKFDDLTLKIITE
jgi:hypothetical protein